MFTHLFTCKKCGATIKFKTFGFSSRTKCPQCNKSYIVVKNFMIRIIEAFILLAIAARSFVFMPNIIIESSILTIIVFCIILIVGNIIFDMIMDKGLKMKNYYTLIEKTESLNKKSK